MEKSKRPSYARQLIGRVSYLTLATVSLDGQPWNTPVFGVYDGIDVFYWCSRRDTQHSRNIIHNARGFIVIYDSTVEPYHGEAVYAQVLCAELNEHAEIDRAIDLLYTHLGKPSIDLADIQGTGEYRLYKATAKNVWIKDPKKDVRQPTILTD